MKIWINILLLSTISLCLISCQLYKSVKTLNVEVIRPGLVDIPNNIGSVSIINLTDFDDVKDKFSYEENDEKKDDYSVNYNHISNLCVDALSNYLQKTKYISKVSKLKNVPIDNNNHSDVNSFFGNANSDMLILLKKLRFKISLYSNTEESTYINSVNLFWEIHYKNQVDYYSFTQKDELVFTDKNFDCLKKKCNFISLVVDSSGVYLGRRFGSRLIPSKDPGGRIYYTSKNPQMSMAEKFAIQNQWIKAAEIWKNLSENKNKRIAAKSCFNLALACEMEGKIDASFDWLGKSLKYESDPFHQQECQKYTALLLSRLKDIEKLDKQIRDEN